MKERPILMSAPMVRACRRVEKPKTQTRRVVKGDALEWLGAFSPDFVGDSANHLSPYGVPSDRLWVREAWKAPDRLDHVPPRDMAADTRISYMADDRLWPCSRGRPGIHMPRWACRLVLEVAEVRIERLQDCSEQDALAEGITEDWVIIDAHCAGGHHTEVHGFRYFWEGGAEEGYDTAVEAYRDLWDSINGHDPVKRWGANPWVWAITFAQVPA